MGLSGDVFLAALLGAFTILIVYQELIRRGNFRLVALFISTVVTVVSSVHWLARPHMFTFFFVALWTYWLERFYKNENKAGWYFPVLMLIWVNTHGAFIAGFVVLGTYMADWIWEYLHGRGTREMGKQLFLIGLLSFAVTFINPSGIDLWGTSVGYVSNEFMTSHTVEYLSPDFHEKDVWPFLFMVAFALFALMQDRKIQVREALLLAGWSAMSLYSVRNMPLFAVITAPIYGALIQPWAEKMLHGLKQAQSGQSRGTGPRESEEVLRGYVWIVMCYGAGSRSIKKAQGMFFCQTKCLYKRWTGWRKIRRMAGCSIISFGVVIFCIACGQMRRSSLMDRPIFMARH
jgi:hypothetical protein